MTSIKATGIQFFLFLIILFSSAFGARAGEPDKKNHQENLVMNVQGLGCHHGLHHQPNGPFAALVFCEDALGTYVAVICYDAGRCEHSVFRDGSIHMEGWALEYRTWQEQVWASDVNSFAWSPDGKSLFIATNEIYGSGGIFQLDLEGRHAKQILPEHPVVSVNSPGDDYSIISIDNDSLSYQRSDEDGDHVVASKWKLHPNPKGQ